MKPDGKRRITRMTSWQRSLLGIGSLFLFIYSILILTRSINLLRPHLFALANVLVHSPGSALATGWFGAAMLFNGSAVAALSLSLFDAELLTDLQLFLMLSGTRLGATTFVLLLGGIEFFRHRDHSLPDSTFTGVLNFFVTVSLYLPASLLGVYFISEFPLTGFERVAPRWISGLLEIIFGPTVRITLRTLGPGLGFAWGMLVLYGSLELFETVVQGLQMQQIRRMVSTLIDNPWSGFIMGSVLTFLAASVSITIGIVVPLQNRGLIDRRQIIPYMLGANWTTMADTLLASVVLKNPGAMKSVLLLFGLVGLLALIAMTVILPYGRAMEFTTSRVVNNQRLFWGFLIVPAPLLGLVWYFL